MRNSCPRPQRAENTPISGLCIFTIKVPHKKHKASQRASVTMCEDTPKEKTRVYFSSHAESENTPYKSEYFFTLKLPHNKNKAPQRASVTMCEDTRMKYRE